MIRRMRASYSRLAWRNVALVGICALVISAFLAFARPVVMIVDGQRIDSDVTPVTTASDKAFVPLRSIADALGAQTELDRKTGAIDVVRGNQSLRVKIGDTHATLNGMPLTLGHAPFRVRGRVMISLNAIARAFNVRANYDARDARINVITPGVGEAPGAGSATQ